ncbi:exopolysaccharide biosynthesis protein [Phenylobacterium sp. J426]|uniref:exopolysaccharide biosynthesis protein n=1 Tax=Phenylobacterium sp. J426 TaxID=2898439 RepID=UPI0021517CC2|nr:exopolysaccharide biosynthesis protein [Phenylobacterium sp. J426]MCR5873728.1 exopolysaccharide biosynthesis protein [Phenylobacterium sp. J426]
MLLSDRHQPLSEVLQEIAETPSERISVNELSARFGGRALGALLLVFGVLCLLPLPPGGTTIFGLPLLLLAPQLMLGAQAPWLPQRLRHRPIELDDLRAGLPKVARWLKRIEALSRPRLTFLFGGVGQRVIGFVCTLLAVVLILPIPLGNLLPAAAVCVLALSLVQRGGLLALLGYAVALTSASVLVLAASLIISVFQHARTLIGAA